MLRCACISALLVCARTSQFQQWQVLELLHRFVPPTNRFYVEFGNPCTRLCPLANSYNLALSGWRGLILDASFENETLNMHRHWVTSQNVESLFAMYGVPREVDYVSIDIDSADLWVMRAIMASRFRPQIVSVEYNVYLNGADLTLPDPATMQVFHGMAGWERTCYYGASGRSLVLAAALEDYILVASQPFLDLFFVREDLWPRSPMLSAFEALVVRNEDAPPGFNGTAAGKRSHHKAMSRQQAENLLHFGTWQRTRNLSLARMRAQQELRRLKQEHLVQGRLGDCFTHL